MMKNWYDIEHIWTQLDKKEKPLIIFGAGKTGERVYSVLKLAGIDIAGFCDNDVRKQGLYLKGKPIFSIAEILSKFENINILVAVTHKLVSSVVGSLSKKIPNDNSVTRLQ